VRFASRTVSSRCLVAIPLKNSHYFAVTCFKWGAGRQSASAAGPLKTLWNLLSPECRIFQVVANNGEIRRIRGFQSALDFH